MRSRCAAAILAALVGVLALTAPVRVQAQSLIEFLQGGINSAKINVVRGAIGGILNTQLPLELDAKTSYPTVDAPPGGPFLPKLLQPSVYRNLQKPLPPGDYVVRTYAYCTEYSAHLPGSGLAYRLAPLQGKSAGAIANLLARGSLKGIPAARLEAVTWAIESGLTYQRMPASYQELIDRLIPDYKGQVEDDFVQQVQDNYQRYSRYLNLPSLDSLLSGMGAAGQFALSAERVRNTLLQQNTTDKIRTQTLFAGEESGVYEPVVADQGPWTARVPGVAYMRFIIRSGNLADDNLMQIRIVRQPNAPETAYPSLAQLMGLSASRDETLTSSGMIGYSMGQAAQALMPELPSGYALPNPRPSPASTPSAMPITMPTCAPSSNPFPSGTIVNCPTSTPATTCSPVGTANGLPSESLLQSQPMFYMPPPPAAAEVTNTRSPSPAEACTYPYLPCYVPASADKYSSVSCAESAAAARAVVPALTGVIIDKVANKVVCIVVGAAGPEASAACALISGAYDAGSAAAMDAALGSSLSNWSNQNPGAKSYYVDNDGNLYIFSSASGGIFRVPFWQLEAQNVKAVNAALEILAP